MRAECAVPSPGGFALGAQAGEAAIRQVITDAGFTEAFRRAAETPFSLVYEVRPSALWGAASDWMGLQLGEGMR